MSRLPQAPTYMMIPSKRTAGAFEFCCITVSMLALLFTRGRKFDHVLSPAYSKFKWSNTGRCSITARPRAVSSKALFRSLNASLYRTFALVLLPMISPAAAPSSTGIISLSRDPRMKPAMMGAVSSSAPVCKHPEVSAESTSCNAREKHEISKWPHYGYADCCNAGCSVNNSV